MAYNDAIADRVRKLLKRRMGFTERKMFGGIAFMLNGNMCCGAVDDDIVPRLGSELAGRALDKPHTREMDFTGQNPPRIPLASRPVLRYSCGTRHAINSGERMKKMPKQKTHKGLKKRVKVSARGKVLHKRANGGHLMSGKSAKRRRRLRATVSLGASDLKRVKASLGL